MSTLLRPHRRIASACAAVVLAAAITAGCGGGDDGTDAGTKGRSTGPLTSRALASRADELCADARQELDKLGLEARLPERQEIVEGLHDGLDELQPRAPRSDRDDLAMIVDSAAVQPQLIAADEEVRAASEQRDPRAASIPAEEWALLEQRNEFCAALKIGPATDASARLGAKACADMQGGVPATAARVEGSAPHVVVPCYSFDRPVVYSRITPKLASSDVLTQVECGASLEVLARGPATGWFYVEAPGGERGWARLDPRFTPRDPATTADGACGTPEDEGNPSAMGNLVTYEEVDNVVEIADVNVDTNPEVPTYTTACGDYPDTGAQVSCIRCRPVPEREFPPQPGGGLPDLTATIQQPATGSASDGCTLHVVVTNQGDGWTPSRFSLRIKAPRGNDARVFESMLGFRPGYRYEDTEEELLGVKVGQTLTGPFVAVVDPGNEVRESDESNNTARYANPGIICSEVR